MYDAKNKCYVKLEDIAYRIRTGNDISVACRVTRNDVTASVLRACLNITPMPEDKMIALIRGIL